MGTDFRAVLRVVSVLIAASALASAGCAGLAWRGESERWLSAMKSEDNPDRWKATAELALIPDPSVIEPLIVFLTDVDPDRRTDAAAVLGDYLDAPSNFDRMAFMLDGRTDEDRRKTAKLFGCPVPPPGYDWDRYKAEMCAQAVAVQRALTVAFRKALSENKDPRKTAILFGALRIGVEFDWSQIEAPRVGKAAVGPLVSVLKDEDFMVRAGAAVALGKIGDPLAVEPVIALLQDNHPHVRWQAARALADFQDSRAVKPLIAALKRMPIPLEVKGYRCGNQTDPEWEPAGGAAWSLGKLKAKEAVEPLIAALEQDDGYFRACAAEALGRIGDSRAVQPLVAVFRGDAGPWAVSHSITTKALARLGKPAIAPLIEALKDEKIQINACIALGDIGEAAVEPLLEFFRQPVEHSARHVAGMALAKIKDPRVVQGLASMLQDKDKDLRLDAIQALRDTEDPRIVPPLLAIVENRQEEENTRNEALCALVSTPDRQAIGPVTRVLLNDTSEPLVYNAGWVLSNLPGLEPVETLLECARNNKDSMRRAGALNGLGHVQDARVVPLLFVALKDADDNLRQNAVESLGRLRETKALELLRVMAKNDPNEYVRQAATRAVKEIEEPAH